MKSQIYTDKTSMRFVKPIFFFCILLSSQSFAEYRVFLLKITNLQTQDYRMVASTLDPIQYPYYYSLQANEKVSYTETWRCYGRTGDFKEYCPNPKAQPPQASNQNQGPAPAANP